MDKKILITQSNYIPWKGYFDAINMVDECVLYDDMQYTKRDWRNRNKIKTAQGAQWLSIPVEVKGKYFQKINETQLSNKDWNLTHWNTIKNSYAKAPFFNEYKNQFEELYLGCNESFLSKINYRFLKGICEMLNINTKFTWSSEYELRGDKSEKLLNICLDSNSTIYYSGPAAKDYLEVKLFKEKNIQVEWIDYSSYKEYPQLFPPFEHGVSVIDLIFNTGKDALFYLKSKNSE